jgi:hypothetical protein
VLHRDVELQRDLLGIGRVTEVAREQLHCRVDVQHSFLHPARHVQAPTGVAEVALDLAEDGGHRVAREGVAAAGVVAVDRFHQREARHLHQILEGFARALVTARQLAGERQKALDQLVARGCVALALVAQEELLLLTAPDGPWGGA